MQVVETMMQDWEAGGGSRLDGSISADVLDLLGPGAVVCDYDGWKNVDASEQVSASPL